MSPVATIETEVPPPILSDVDVAEIVGSTSPSDLNGAYYDALVDVAPADVDAFQAEWSEATAVVVDELSSQQLHELAVESGHITPQVDALLDPGDPLAEELVAQTVKDWAAGNATSAELSSLATQLAADGDLEVSSEAEFGFLEGDEPWTGQLSEFLEAVSDAHSAPDGASSIDQLALENRVWSYVPDPADQVVVDKAKVALVASTFIKTPFAPLPGLTEVEEQHLSGSEKLALARISSGYQLRSNLKAKAQLLDTTTNKAHELAAGVWDTPPASIADLAGWAKTNASVEALRQKAIQLSDKYPGQVSKAFPSPAEATVTFMVWAKEQNLGDLRTAAAELGLKDPKVASRDWIQKYIVASWDPSISASEIQAKVSNKAAKLGGAASAVPKPAPKKPKAAKLSKFMAATPVGSTLTNFAAQVKALRRKTEAAKALHNDLPSPTAPAKVQSHEWSNGAAFGGGSHESWTYTGPDDSKWMFKPDKSNNGARAHAEAAASRIAAAAGVATVDVHAVKIGKKTGAIQPLVPGCSQWSAEPSTWTQSDVDQVVSLHAVSWAIGDHDGHSGNVLKTPSGALLGVDHGQAFKFVGSDKLDASWKPSSNPAPAIYQSLYAASKSGSLGEGVQVRAAAALPAIKKLQSMPDAEYRAILEKTAIEGATHNVHWVDKMRSKAISNGTDTPTKRDIADAFLDEMCDRKNRLAKDFGAFFKGIGVKDHHVLGLV